MCLRKDSLCYFNTCFFPVFFFILSPCRLKTAGRRFLWHCVVLSFVDWFCKAKHRGHLLFTVFGKTKKRLRYALRHSTAAWGRAYKNRFVKTVLNVAFRLCTWLLGASPCFHNYLAVFGICWYPCVRCRAKSEECISVIYTVYMESGKKLLGYAREIACFSKTVVKERNTAQRFLCPLCRICDVSVMDR